MKLIAPHRFPVTAQPGGSSNNFFSLVITSAVTIVKYLCKTSAFLSKISSMLSVLRRVVRPSHISKHFVTVAIKLFTNVGREQLQHNCKDIQHHRIQYPLAIRIQQ